MDNDNLPPYGQMLNFIKLNESLDSFNGNSSEPESKPEIEGIHLHLKDMSD